MSEPATQSREKARRVRQIERGILHVGHVPRRGGNAIAVPREFHRGSRPSLTRFNDGSLRYVPPRLRGKAHIKAAKRARQRRHA